ncbi:interferon alpha-inducible protein 27-like protein 2 [Tamandua tetradactyla]|uniref:interferon alpha-inducible protein 27-like protein 2 n=1 Tax=Tamandua tetradactyla TaxID=48850 RepID=UPI00405455CD
MLKRVAAAAIGGVVAVGAVPLVLSAVGFTSAGIAASSVAAKMMSAAAIANGGGVTAGSLVATLQSVGAAGLSTSSNILLGSAGSALGAWLGNSKKATPSPPPAEPRAEKDQSPGENEPQVEPPKTPLKSEKHEK